MESEDKAIIFVGRKLIADQISSDLSLKGIVCQCIHGDRDQIDREQVTFPSLFLSNMFQYFCPS